MRRLVTAFLCLLLIATAGFAQSASSALDPFLKSVQRTVLPNGLTVLTREVPGSGVVAINTWVKAGYFNEPDEVAGMAHLFEHMFFKGSKKFPGAEMIAQELSSVGGQTNAGTIYDSTNYYFVLPKEGFRRGVEIQADALMNPLFDPAELKKEAEVVIEESNRKYDNAPAVSVERMFATAFTDHRMKRWRIGSNEVLRNIKRDNLLAFFETLYRPENIVVVVVGDVKPDEALKAVRDTFGQLPKGKLDKKRGPVEPPQTAFRYGQSSADLKQGYSVLGYHTPGIGNPDEVTLDLLSQILGGGRSSRLYRAAVGPDAASTVNAFHFTFDDVGMFGVQASFDEAKRAEVDRRTLREIERMRQQGPTDYELQLAKNQLESTAVFDLQDVLGQAQTLAYAEANGGYRRLTERLAKIRSATPQQLRDAARKYLTTENLTLYHYRPKGAAEMSQQDALAFVKGVEAGTGEQAAVALPPAPAAVKLASADRPARRVTLDNGVTLVIRERPGAPVVTTGVYFPGGRVDENSANAGVTGLMARTMRKGTSSRSGEDIDREIEFLGTELESDVQADYFGFVVSILSGNYRPGIALLSDVILNPTFPADGVTEERHLQTAAIKRAFDSSTQRPFELMNRALYGNHAYGLPPNGDLVSVQGLDGDAIRAWWKDHVVADGAVIFVAGNIDGAEAESVLKSAFAKLPKRSRPRRMVVKPLPPAARMDIVEHRDRKQSAITVAYPTVTRGHEDWPKLRLLQNVTSGLAGTFFAELRGKRSLAYTVFAGEQSLNQDGYFYAYLATDAAKEADAKKALLEEIAKLPKDEFTDKDVERAKTYFAGSTRIGRQTNAALVNEYARALFLGLDLDFVDRLLEKTAKVTAKEVRDVAGKYLTGPNYAMALVSGKAPEAPAGK
jgi:zinc protease